MLNIIWLGMVVVGIALGAVTGRLAGVGEAIVKNAETAVTLSIGLIGLMSLWLGMMRLAERSGLVLLLARALKPLLRRLFPDVPTEHPAMGAMVMNIAANMLGLSNAATPMGLRAMQELQKLNPKPDTATNAMCTFLAINTSSVQLVPMTAIALMVAAGASRPYSIIGTALLATACSTIAGLIAVKWFERWPAFRLPVTERVPSNVETDSPKPLSVETERQAGGLRWSILALFLLVMVYAGLRMLSPEAEAIVGQTAAPDRSMLWRLVSTVSLLAVPFLVGFIPLYAWVRGLQVYEELVEGAKEGFQVAVRIIPYLVGMLVAIGIFRASGGLDLLARATAPILAFIHFPTELLPMALMRPLSGSGSMAILSDVIKTHGPDSLLAQTAATLYGSTETTFYVLAVYFGSISIRRTRHALMAGLIADGVGILAAVYICRWMQ